VFLFPTDDIAPTTATMAYVPVLLALPAASQRKTDTSCTAGESYATTSNVFVSIVVRPRLSVIVTRIVFVPAVFSSFVEKEPPEYVAPLTVVETDEIEDPYTPADDIMTLSLLLRCTKQLNCAAKPASDSVNESEPVGMTLAGLAADLLTCVVPRRTPWE
jgi:hypothetical protein